MNGVKWFPSRGDDSEEGSEEKTSNHQVDIREGFGLGTLGHWKEEPEISRGWNLLYGFVPVPIEVFSLLDLGSQLDHKIACFTFRHTSELCSLSVVLFKKKKIKGEGKKEKNNFNSRRRND